MSEDEGETPSATSRDYGTTFRTPRGRTIDETFRKPFATSLLVAFERSSTAIPSQEHEIWIREHPRLITSDVTLTARALFLRRR